MKSAYRAKGIRNRHCLFHKGRITRRLNRRRMPKEFDGHEVYLSYEGEKSCWVAVLKDFPRDAIHGVGPSPEEALQELRIAWERFRRMQTAKGGGLADEDGNPELPL